MTRLFEKCPLGETLVQAVGAAHSLFRAGTSREELEDPVLLELAARHRVLFSLHQYLLKFVSREEQAPPHVIEQRLLTVARHQLRVQQALSSARDVLTTRRIPFLLYKGLALESRFYEGIPRPSGDIDLLVTKEELRGAFQALIEIGAEQIEVNSEDERKLTLHGVLIELQTSLVEPYIARMADPAVLMQSRQRLQLRSGLEVWTLDDIDHVIALLVHGFKHQWCRLLWILDIALALRTLGPHAREKLFVRAHRYRIERILRIGLFLTYALFPFEEEGTEVFLERWISEKYEKRLFRNDVGILFKMQNIGLHLLGIESARTRIRYLLARAGIRNDAL